MSSVGAFVVFGIPAGRFALRGHLFREEGVFEAEIKFGAKIDAAALEGRAVWIPLPGGLAGPEEVDDQLAEHSSIELSFNPVSHSEAGDLFCQLLLGDGAPEPKQTEVRELFNEVLEHCGTPLSFFDAVDEPKTVGLLVLGAKSTGLLLLSSEIDDDE